MVTRFTLMQKSMICSACKSNRIITDHDSVEVVCTSCGLVISDNVEEAQAIRHLISTKTNEVYDRTINTSSPISLARYDMGLSTIMGKPTKDASGNVLDAATRSRMARLKTWDLRITPNNSCSNRSLREACAHLRVLKDKLGLPDAAVEKAAYIYRKAKNKGRTWEDDIGSLRCCRIYRLQRTRDTKNIKG